MNGLHHVPIGASPRRSRRRTRTTGRRGMTLIETALATVIVGTGVLAIVAAQQAFHKQNAWSTHASIATRLGNEIREMTLNLSRHDPVNGTAYWGPEPNEVLLEDYNDLDDFDGLVFSADAGTGPINAQGQIIPNMDGWTQTIEVNMVDASDINEYYDVPDEADEYPEAYLMRMTVTVSYQGINDLQPSEVTRVTWLSPN